MIFQRDIASRLALRLTMRLIAARLIFVISVLFIFAAIVCSPEIHPAFAGDKVALDEAYHRWEELENQGNYREAIPYAKQVVRLEKEFDPNSKYVGGALNHLGVLYQRLGNYAEAEKFLQPSFLSSAHKLVTNSQY